jgi:hypothetical protein
MVLGEQQVPQVDQRQHPETTEGEAVDDGHFGRVPR